jgi:hypothetical protein
MIRKTGRQSMIVREIVHTCSNAHVARAALASIGGDFARHFAAKASRRNLPAGVLAARIVTEFARNAADDEWDGVDVAARSADQPILSGLQYILARGLRGRLGSEDADLSAARHRYGGAAS